MLQIIFCKKHNLKSYFEIMLVDLIFQNSIPKWYCVRGSMTHILFNFWRITQIIHNQSPEPGLKKPVNHVYLKTNRITGTE